MMDMTGEDILLRELSHRTANSLQVAVAALHLGRRGRNDLFEEALDRIGGAAELHGLLGQAPASLDQMQALVAICHATRRAAGASASVRLDFDLQPVDIPIASTRPVGMILSELVSNSIRHAFQNGTGRIAVSVGASGGGVEIAVEDDGSCAGWSRPDGQGHGIVDGLAHSVGGHVVRMRTAKGSARVVLTLPASQPERLAGGAEAA
jgi:two-component sensor histidine kinase